MVFDKIIKHFASAQKMQELYHGRAKAGPYLQAVNRRTANACLRAAPWGNIFA
jgi:hypothetical protein